MAKHHPLPDSVTIEVPLGDLTEGYLSRHIDVALDGAQRKVLRRLVIGLREADEQLANRKPVQGNADAIKWLLEACANGKKPDPPPDPPPGAKAKKSGRSGTIRTDPGGPDAQSRRAAG